MKNSPRNDQQTPEELIRTILTRKYQDLAAEHKELLDRDAMILQKDGELLQQKAVMAEQHDKIKYYESLLEFVNRSKFWKLRNKYFKYGFNKFYPGHIRNLVKYHTQKKSNLVVGPTDSFATTEKQAFTPKVTVIVPNYNHEKFLKQRLDSIYRQTYKNFEVILLDDQSTDGSLKILKRYAARYSKKSKLVVNTRNEGSVFGQWKKGVSLAKGDLIWVAESDDYCDTDFLEKLVATFKDESVMLAYAFPQFVGAQGQAIEFAFENYVAELSTTKWQKSYVESAHNEVSQALGIKNTIPNVSGVVFRNISPAEFNYDAMKEFKVCGDWYFYLSIIRGGRLAYVKETTNYYRFHGNNTSSNYQKDIGFVQEFERIAKHVVENYKVDRSTIRKNRESVRRVWESQNPGKESKFAPAFSLKKVFAEQTKRKPNLVIGLSGFTTGGGETIPIRLANKMKDDGFAVTVFDLTEQTLVNQTTRTMLKSSIPVFKKGTLDLDAFLKDFGTEIIHSHHTIVDLYFSRRTTKSIPHVVSTHGLYETLMPQFAQDIGPSIKHVDYWVYTADKNLQSMKIYPWFKNRPKTKIINGYEPDRRVSKAISRQQLNISEDAFVVCLASRAIREKGWREAIDAVKIANTKSQRPIFLILIGDGPLKDMLRPQVDPSEVLLLGFKENIFDYFAFADIGLLPTTFVGESCPMVLIECISMHTPFISTNVGEIKSMLTLDNGQVAGEVLDLHDGIIDVYQLADTLITFANNSARYDQAKQNAAQLSERFSMNKVAKKYQHVYETLLKNKRRQ